jgi:uncharacterized membrane protein
VANAAKQRIAFLDWIRGFACIGMFETHGYDSWLSESARHTKLFQLSQLGGTLPAPLFLFAAGISVALVTGRALQKGIPSGQAARGTMLRGAQVLGFGLLFRLQEFLLGQPHAPWSDLLRVDVLNVIGVSIILMGFLLGLISWLAELRNQAPGGISNTVSPAPRWGYVVSAIVVAAAITLATPALWTTHRRRWLPWFLESYLNGVHNLGVPQSWLFPLFPWAAFAFAGLAFGFLFLSPWARAHEAATIFMTGLASVLLFALGRWLDARPLQLYAVYDFWHTSPNFFLMRTGIVLGVVFLAYLWCRWGAALKGFSPIMELGRTSLFVYWVHLEFVYGRVSILPKHSQTALASTAGVLVICAAMVALATVRNRMKGRGLGALAFWRTPKGATVAS